MPDRLKGTYADDIREKKAMEVAADALDLLHAFVQGKAAIHVSGSRDGAFEIRVIKDRR